jgi:hypothetical protein
MHRLTAKALVFVLLFVTFAPITATPLVRSGYASGEHCARRPIRAHTGPLSDCHHHNRIAQSASSAAHLHSKPCCDGHACCRSQARTQWAYLSLRVSLHEGDRTPDAVVKLAELAHTSGVEHYRPARASAAL